MRGLVDKIMALEGKDRVLSVSIGHCFHYGDVPESGARVLVLTDDAKPHGDRLAEEIGRELIALREQAHRPNTRSMARSTRRWRIPAARP